MELRPVVQQQLFERIKLKHNRFTIRDLLPIASRIAGRDVARRLVDDDLAWYAKNGWLEQIGTCKRNGKCVKVLAVVAHRDITRIKYRNQCLKKHLTR